jgi:ubiquinone/menaquinone biosynthesis C-methylase UbiE
MSPIRDSGISRRRSRDVPTMSVREERAGWDAAVSDYERWWPVSVRATQHINRDLVRLARVAPGARVLDIATGMGEPAVTAARAVGANGRVLGTDFAIQMLVAARRRAATLEISNLKFCVCDAASLCIASESVDSALCRFGLMFVDDLDSAASEVHRVLRTDGWFAAAVWSTPDKAPMDMLFRKTSRLAGVPAPANDVPKMWRLADPAVLEGALRRAGFRTVEIDRSVAAYEFDSAETFLDVRRASSTRFREALNSQPPEQRRQAIACILDLAREYEAPGGRVRIDNEAILFAAQA